MRRGTQDHVAAPRGPTRRLRNDVTYVLFTCILVIVHIVFRLSEDYYYPFNTSHNIHPRPSFNFIRVALSSTEFIFYAGDVAKSEALDHNRSATIECTRGPPHLDHARGYLKGVITVVI